MRRSRITLAAITLALASAGGIAYAATTGGSGGSGYGASGAPAATADPGKGASGQPVVRVVTATVQGKTMRILVDAGGMPLYTFAQDTATASHVTGQLAALWPPLISSASPAGGTTAPVGFRTTANGQQVTYQGHFLYTFVEDRPGRVTGQGVSDFFVATPDAGAPATTGASPGTMSGGY